MANLPSTIDLQEEDDQVALLQELIREMAKIHQMLSLRLNFPTEQRPE